MERLHFCCLSYDDYSNYFKGKVDVGVIVTMNTGKMFYKTMYQSKIKGELHALNTLNGKIEIYPCFDTLQVNDYSKYNMASFNEEHKKQVRETQFPKDLEKAFEMGARLGRKEKE